MINKPDKNKIRVARHRRTRKNIMGTAECPRMDVFRSNSHIYVHQLSIGDPSFQKSVQYPETPK